MNHIFLRRSLLVLLGLAFCGLGASSMARTDLPAPAKVHAQGQVQNTSIVYTLSETWASQPPPTHVEKDWPAEGIPGGVGRAPEGDLIYITDLESHSVRVHDGMGIYLRSIGQRGFGDGAFFEPRDVDGLTGGRIAVSDSGNNRVQVLDSSGLSLAAWPVNAPYGLEVVDDWIYVLSRADRRIYAFDADGNSQRMIDLSSKLSAPEGLSYRGSIDSGSSERPYANFTISDPTSRLVIGARDNSNNLPTFLTGFLQPQSAVQWVDQGSQYWVLGEGGRGLLVTQANGDVAAEIAFDSVPDLELLPDGSVFASTVPGGLVHVPDLQYLLEKDTNTFGRLLQPKRIDAGADLLIADGAPRVQSWSLAGAPNGDLRFDELGLPTLPEIDQAPAADVSVDGNDRFVLWYSGAIRRVESLDEAVPESIGARWIPTPGTIHWLVGLSAHAGQVASFDLANQSIVFFDRTLANIVRQWSVAAEGFSGAVDIALSADRVYLVDRHTYRLTVWSYDGQLLAERSMAGRPERVAADPDGNAFVLTRAGWVLAFNALAEPIGAWPVATGDQLPSDIAIDDAGRLYVTDLKGEIRVYDRDLDAPGGLPQLGDATSCGAIAFKSASPNVIELGEEVEVQLVVDGVCPDEDKSVDVVLTIDRSGSMFGRKMQAALRAGINFALKVDGPRSRIGVTTFSNGADEVTELTEDRAQTIRGIASVTAGGSTNVVAGLSQAWQTMMAAPSRAESPKVIIFLSDGRHSIGSVSHPRPEQYNRPPAPGQYPRLHHRPGWRCRPRNAKAHRH